MQTLVSCTFLLTSVLLLREVKCSLQRIVGGREVKTHEFPYQLSLRYDGRHFCGAALISKDVGLTAAHCIAKPGIYSVRAGSDYVDKGGVVVFVKEALVHPSHSDDTEDYDLTILKLKEPLRLSDAIKPLRLPNQDEPLPKNAKGLVTGWGTLSSFVDQYPERMRVVELPLLDRQMCQESYQIITKVTPRMFCAGYREGGRDSCQGDSGGPFVVNGTLYGLVSWGFNCGEPGYPGVYTNISSLSSYIALNVHV